LPSLPNQIRKDPALHACIISMTLPVDQQQSEPKWKYWLKS